MLDSKQREALKDQIITAPAATKFAPLCALSGQAWQGSHYTTVHLRDGYKIRYMSKYNNYFDSDIRQAYLHLLPTKKPKQSKAKESDE